MPTLLTAKPVLTTIKQTLTAQVKEFQLSSKYLAIIHLGDNSSSEVYIRMKQKFGKEIGLPVTLFRASDIMRDPTGNVQPITQDELITFIQALNDDHNCLGMILQLPLPQKLFPYTNEIYSHVDPYKDIDGLGGKIMGLASQGVIDFLPATAGAVMTLLQFYELADVQGKRIAIIGQSNLLGKPLAAHLINQGATVYSFNHHSDQDAMKQLCRESDYIVSCTGVVHLIDPDFVRDDHSQVIVDVGYGHRDGKAVGDVDFDTIVDTVAAITPVPGGVGPLTVAQLFVNAIYLSQRKHIL